ncbi:MAG: RNA polymerase subunit sigma [Cellvibrio sp. 79]|nr:MAG: RNA polymerase subunit sigma [Cellvibrio sp. 79]
MHLPPLEDLYRDHQPWLKLWLQRRLGCSHNAADLAQDTFVRLLAKPEQESLNNPRAYLRTIAHGLLVNWFRRKDLERAYLEALAALPEEEAPSPELRYQLLEMLEAVDQMLHQLPTPVRRAFLLAQIEGLKYEEIANQMEIALITVKRYMKQAFVQCLTLELTTVIDQAQEQS